MNKEYRCLVYDFNTQVKKSGISNEGKNRFVNLLKDGKLHSSDEISKVLGFYDVNGAVRALRKEGHKIICLRTGWAKYSYGKAMKNL